MNRRTLLEAIAARAAHEPARPALVGYDCQLDYAGLQQAIAATGRLLDGRCIGLLADNGPAWIVADLAALRHSLPCVPLPPFFTPQQLRHVVQDAGIDLLLTDRPGQIAALLPDAVRDTVAVAGLPLAWFRIAQPERAPAASAKVTYTSGTTGTPKGVCLAAETLDRVAASLATATAATPADRLLSLLPLATLLENIAVHAALRAGACALLPPLAAALSTPGSGDGRQVLRQLRSLRPSVLNLVPQLLQQLVEAAESGQSAPSSLRFIAVGGAPLAGALLERAARCGLPVFQGYGLSEAASVVTLSTPSANRVGSVGRPLPHTRVRIAASGEILVRGATFSGYLGLPPRTASGWLATGDLGHVDDDGYLHVTGRIDHRFVTAHGRNVSPEWPEQVLLSRPGILQALVFGHARPFNVALLVPGEACGARRLERAVASANDALPGYAQVRRYLVADEPFTVANGLLTPTRRPRREAILARYAARLEALYAEHS